MDLSLRAQIRQRAEGRCEYCRLPDVVQLLPFHVEHIIARQHGGGDEESNLAWACDRCNAYKGPNIASLEPDTRKVVGLFHPRTNRWTEHFMIRDGEIVGVTSVGRATVRLLQFNARHRIELRRELIDQRLFE